MRQATRRVAFIGEQDLHVAEALRESGFRTDAAVSAGAFGLARELYRLRPTVIHASRSHLTAAILGRVLGVPVVLQVGKGDVTQPVARAAKLADRTLCGGAVLREALLDLGAPASTTCILRSLSDVTSDVRASSMFPPMLDPAIRWVVAATPVDGEGRGHQDLLLAFLSVARTRPKLKLLIAGDGPDARGLRAQAAAAGMLSRVIVHPLAPAQLASVFARAAAVVGPSREGSRPDPIPEALAAGAAVVATAVGQHTSWIREGRTGWLVPARAPVALATRLAMVVDDPEAARKAGENARKAVLELAQPRALAQELSRCYAAVARQPAPLATGLYIPAPARSLSRAG